jgi:hypothetical protein
MGTPSSFTECSALFRVSNPEGIATKRRTARSKYTFTDQIDQLIRECYPGPPH